MDGFVEQGSGNIEEQVIDAKTLCERPFIEVAQDSAEYFGSSQRRWWGDDGMFCARTALTMGQSPI